MNPSTVPADIYRMLMNKEVNPSADVEHIADVFAAECRTALVDALGAPQKREGRLRMSSIGKPDRVIYNEYTGVEGEQLAGSDYIKFLYGHMVEALLIALTELSGHEVTEKQKKVSVDGVNGSQDFRIDGVLADAKSASPYGFKKFATRQMPFDDPFGYVAQIKGYAAAEGDKQYGWLVMNKVNGELCWAGYDEDNLTAEEQDVMLYDIRDRITAVKKLVAEAIIPSICYSPEPDGKSGNMKLASGCSFCPYKAHCFPESRAFAYSYGIKYLTKVVKTPNVTEIVEGF